MPEFRINSKLWLASIYVAFSLNMSDKYGYFRQLSKNCPNFSNVYCKRVFNVEILWLLVMIDSGLSVLNLCVRVYYFSFLLYYPY